MSSKFKNKYRIDSARLKGWNYSNSAAYFVTICTRNRKHFFGKINNGIMDLSSLGDIAEQEWIKSVALRPDMNLSLGEFVVMPNHFHAIIFIGENEFNTPECIDNNPRTDAMLGVSFDQDATLDISFDQDAMLGVSFDQDAIHGVSFDQDATHGVSTNTNNTENTFGPQSKNLASIIRGFKSAVTTFARNNNLPFDWQPRFHDHVIRNEIEYQRISNYIINNPAKWSY